MEKKKNFAEVLVLTWKNSYEGGLEEVFLHPSFWGLPTQTVVVVEVFPSFYR